MSNLVIKKGDRGPHVTTLRSALDRRRTELGLPGIIVSNTMGGPGWRAWEETYIALGGLPGTFSGGRVRALRRYQYVRFPGTRGTIARARAETWRNTHGDGSLKRRALREAERLIGVMEQGGNNRGPGVEQIIRSGGGSVGDAWCGWFNAHCYKTAGSKAVTWQWGAVRLYLPLPGLRRVEHPEAGDIVRFTFDHTGMFVKWVKFVNGKWIECDRDEATHAETIEGNTGTSGAVSDSKTGGDGVYRKRRPLNQIRDFVEVTR